MWRLGCVYERYSIMDPKDIYDLDDSQAHAFNAIIKGHNVFTTGSAGTGKSHLINSVSDYLKTGKVARRFVITSLTGLSALIINGTTIHSFLGVGAYDPDSPDELYVKRAEKLFPVAKKIRETNLVIIDEISMMPCRMLTVMDKIFRVVRRRPNVVFGGMQVVVIGDFFQLPPIYRQPPEDKLKYVFQHPNWLTYFPEQIELRHCHRQNDKEFIRILDLIRRGQMTNPAVEKFLSERMEATRNAPAEELANVPRLFPTKDSVSTHNATKLRSLSTTANLLKAKVYRVEYIGVGERPHSEPRPRQRSTATSDSDSLSANHLLDITQYRMVEEHDETKIERLFKNTIIERTLEIKEGALVMFTRNLDASKGIVNGTMGIVRGIARYADGNHAGDMETIYVRTLGGQDFWVSKELMMCGLDYAIEQVPLILAWAISIHKSQGSSYDRICIDVGQRLFEYGQAYVALSRCRSPQSLYLTEMCVKAFRTDPLVCDFYNKTFGPPAAAAPAAKEDTESECELVVAKLWMWQGRTYYVTPDNEVYTEDSELIGTRVDNRLVIASN